MAFFLRSFLVSYLYFSLSSCQLFSHTLHHLVITLPMMHEILQHRHSAVVPPRPRWLVLWLCITLPCLSFQSVRRLTLILPSRY
ncbi:hypothetical protein BDZ97DRAFT_1165050 [Flammula alnicola]|nr:hypothetical protein BDZ97DRAFT_1165050 [Flammula alnicola]